MLEQGSRGHATKEFILQRTIRKKILNSPELNSKYIRTNYMPDTLISQGGHSGDPSLIKYDTTNVRTHYDSKKTVLKASLF